jgi:plastocyanin
VTHARGSQEDLIPEEVRPVRRTLKLLALVAVATVLAAACAGQDEDGGAAAAGPAASATTAAPDRSTGENNGGGGGRGDYGGGGGYGEDAEPTSSRAAGDADTDDVRISDFAFSPATISAKVGQRVKWEHQDSGVTHTVTAVQGGFRSGELEEGDEFSHLFRTTGSFAYRCAIHPDMRGRVKVSG